MGSLRLILGDQLSRDLATLRGCDKQADTILICEVAEETTYVRHHKKKIAFLFAAMRHFARSLERDGYRVRYIRLDDEGNSGSFTGEVGRAVQECRADRVIVTAPGEYRVLEAMQGWQDILDAPVEIRADDRFLCSQDEFSRWAAGRKQMRMEHFYREMRKKYDILIDGKGGPEGGRWNYDPENRKPPGKDISPPPPLCFEPDAITQEVMALVAQRFDDHFGDLEPFYFAVTREQALAILADFLENRLPRFGDYQDVMLQGEPFMYHAHISHYLNCGLLGPLEVIQAAEAAYRDHGAPLNATEGFIRQILGWREYVRGIYWLAMPGYENENFLDARRALPWLYWSGETRMNCLRQCVTETRQNAYAHHIQRLMVLGNFALLAGIDPKDVNEWYLIVYADAYEWVEMPNVSGMTLFADGGRLASKPYAAGGAYINRMSDYCKNCSYKVSKKNGPEACPFNYLYWDFFIRHQDKLAGNPRLGHSYRTLARMDDEKIAAIQDDARRFFAALESGETV